MQAVKKLVLVDEFDREYKRLQRPADAVAKTGRSLQLSHTLDDQSLADDRKVQEYVAALHRYLNTRKEVAPEPTAQVNTLTELPTIRHTAAEEKGKETTTKTATIGLGPARVRTETITTTVGQVLT